jgi:DNA mismatch repair protein MutL
MRFFEQIAIPFPSVHFTLSIDNKKVLEFPIASSPLERIGAVAGNQFARRLIECRGSRPGMEALIYVSSPEDQKEKPRFNSLFVNLRRIDNDSVTFAVREAFSQFLGFSFRPSFFCFLDIDPSRIDVNVHPTKQQVKFDNERDLFGFIFSTVKSSITSTMVQPGSFLTGETPSSVPPPPGTVLLLPVFQEHRGDVHFLSPGAAARDSGQFSDHSSIPREQLRAISERS